MLALVILALLPMTGAPDSSKAVDAMEFVPAPGMFLVAAPEMRDPRFQQSVVLLVEHSAQGALGFIINKKTEITVTEALPELDIQGLAHALYFGGPVQPAQIMYVYSDSEKSAGQRVISGVYWGSDYEILKDFLQNRDQSTLRVFFGYAGWGPGQLEFEVSLDDWQVIPAQPEYIFSEDSENLWRLLNRKKPGVVTEYLAAGSGPDLTVTESAAQSH